MLQNVADFLLRFVKDEFYPILCYIQPHRWRNCVSCSLVNRGFEPGLDKPMSLRGMIKDWLTRNESSVATCLPWSIVFVCLHYKIFCVVQSENCSRHNITDKLHI